MRKSKLTVPLILLCLTTNSFATDTQKTTKTTCNDVLKACDEALQAKDLQIKIRDEQVGQGQAMLNASVKEVEDLKRERDAWYKSPYLYVVLGLAAGVYVGKH